MAALGYTGLQVSAGIQSNAFLRGLAFEASLGAGGQTAFLRWDAPALSYDLRIGEANPDGSATAAWVADLGTAIRTALADISTACRLQFSEVESRADIDFWYYAANDGISGYSYGIDGPGVFINAVYDHAAPESASNGYASGGLSYLVLVHEILHNLGLSHPHDHYARFPGVTGPYDTGTDRLNQAIYTAMSYNDFRQVDAGGQTTTGWPGTAGAADHGYSTLGAFDIAMLQALYGPNLDHATGNTVYRLAEANGEGTYFQCIWDAGGRDAIRYEGASDAVIALLAATLDPEDGPLAGGAISRVAGINGGFTIARGVAIEDAVSGSGNDRLVGNGLANRLVARDGEDKVLGGGGRDVILGGAGRDMIRGQGGGDRLLGGAQNDILRGGGGRDLLIGGDGDDRLFGGRDEDIFRFDLDDGNDRIGDFLDGIDRIELVGAGFGDIAIRAQGGGTLVSFGSTTVLLDGFDPVDLTEADFIFTA